MSRHIDIHQARARAITNQLIAYTTSSSSTYIDSSTTQSLSLHGREYFLDKHELQNHSLAEQRIDEFSEWRCSLRVPLISSSSSCSGMISLSDGSLCIKINDPVSIYCYTAYSAYTKYYTIDFTSLFPLYETFGSTILMSALSYNRLTLYSAQQNQLVYTSMPTKQPENNGGFAMAERGSGTIKLARTMQKSSVTQCDLPQSTVQSKHTYDRHISHTIYKCIDTLALYGILLFYAVDNTSLYVLDTSAECRDHTANQPITHVVDGQTYTEWQHKNFVGEWRAHDLNIKIASIVCNDKHQLIVTDDKQHVYSVSQFINPTDIINVQPLNIDTQNETAQLYRTSYILPQATQTNYTTATDTLPKSICRGLPTPSSDEGANIDTVPIQSTSPNNIFVPYDNQSNTLFHYTLSEQMYNVQTAIDQDSLSRSFMFDTSFTIPLHHTKQIAVPCSKRIPTNDNTLHEDYYIAIVDVQSLTIRYVYIKPLKQHNQISIEKLSGHNANSGTITTFTHTARPIALCETYTGELAVCDSTGFVRIFTVDIAALDKSATQWRSLFGATVNGIKVDISINGKKKEQPHTLRDKDSELRDIDESDDADGVGNEGLDGEGTGGEGGIGSGGSGGKSNSAKAERGKGKGGAPTRDRTGDVSQAAREAAQALSKIDIDARLALIELGADDNILYDEYYSKVQKQVSQLRMILESTEAKMHERVWLNNQNQGDLDDNKLIDALTGERLVYRRRGMQPPEAGAPIRLAKRLMFVVDVSGSMYRFNSTDNRLQRLLESVVLILESFVNLEHKYNYCIVGHSGDGPAIPFVPFDAPPRTRTERLKVLQKMFAHTESCSSGDYTVDAIVEGIKNVASEQGDEYFVLCVSDANLSRYGIGPQQLSNALLRDPKVNSYVLFIAQSGDEAAAFLPQLPPNRAFFVEDTNKLPQVFKDMFSSSKVISE